MGAQLFIALPALAYGGVAKPAQQYREAVLGHTNFQNLKPIDTPRLIYFATNPARSS